MLRKTAPHRAPLYPELGQNSTHRADGAMPVSGRLPAELRVCCTGMDRGYSSEAGAAKAQCSTEMASCSGLNSFLATHAMPDGSYARRNSWLRQPLIASSRPHGRQGELGSRV